jgi:hypothetical protein
VLFLLFIVDEGNSQAGLALHVADSDRALLADAEERFGLEVHCLTGKRSGEWQHAAAQSVE